MSSSRRYGLEASPWRTSIFGCVSEDPKQALDNFLCAPCSIARQMKTLENQPDQYDLEWVAAACFCFACADACLRVRVVTRYGLDEAMPVTILIGLFLGCCSVCQTYREITQRSAMSPGLTIFLPADGSYQQLK